MINWVEMLNWRAYAQRRVEFKPGINFVMGPNGVGKTSILEAVAYALTGEPSTVKERVKLLRDPEQLATVRLSFTLRGEDYLVERAQSYKRAENASLVRLRDSKALAHSHSRVTACIEDLMSVSADFLRRIIYMAEGDVFRFLDKPPGEAIDAQLRQVLGLNQMNQFIYALETAEKQIKGKVKNIQGVLADLDKLGVQRGSELQERLTETKRRKSELSEAFGQVFAEVARREQQFKEREEQRAKIDAIIGVWKANPTWQGLKDMSLKALAEDWANDLERMRQEMRQHEVNSARVGGEAEATQRVLDVLAMLTPGSASVACPVCGKPMAADECAEIARRLQREIEQKREESRKEARLFAEKQKAVLSGEPLLATMQEVSHTTWGDFVLRELDDQRARVQADHDDSLTGQLASLKVEEEKLEQERAAYLTVQRDLQSLELGSPEEARSALVALEVRSLSVRAALGASQETLAAQRNKDMRDIYKQIARFWGIFLGGEEWQVELDSSGMPTLQNETGQTFDLSQFSGGEKTALLITLHTIIAHHFSRSNFLMIDEPLEHLDPVNRRSLIRFLVSAFHGQLFEQAIIATFEESLIRKYTSEEGVNVIHLW